MRGVLDTNVLISGIFFRGLPGRILDEWSEGRFELVLTPAIYDEYVRTCDRLGAQHQGLHYQSILASLAGHGSLVPDSRHTDPITPDPDDDKFIRCAHEHAAIVVSGDRHLLERNGWNGVRVLNPRAFLTFLAKEPS